MVSRMIVTPWLCVNSYEEPQHVKIGLATALTSAQLPEHKPAEINRIFQSDIQRLEDVMPLGPAYNCMVRADPFAGAGESNAGRYQLVSLFLCQSRRGLLRHEHTQKYLS